MARQIHERPAAHSPASTKNGERRIPNEAFAPSSFIRRSSFSLFERVGHGREVVSRVLSDEALKPLSEGEQLAVAFVGEDPLDALQREKDGLRENGQRLLVRKLARPSFEALQSETA